MKQTFAFGAYCLIAVAATYFVEILLSLNIAGILFHAADAPPGDITDRGKLLYSVGIPVVYASVLFTLYYLYSEFLKNFNIHLIRSVGVLFHIMVAIYLVWNVVPDAF